MSRVLHQYVDPQKCKSWRASVDLASDFASSLGCTAAEALAILEVLGPCITKRLRKGKMAGLPGCCILWMRHTYNKQIVSNLFKVNRPNCKNIKSVHQFDSYAAMRLWVPEHLKKDLRDSAANGGTIHDQLKLISERRRVKRGTSHKSKTAAPYGRSKRIGGRNEGRAAIAKSIGSRIGNRLTAGRYSA